MVSLSLYSSPQKTRKKISIQHLVANPLFNNERSNIKNKFKYLYENRGHRKNANVSMPRKANVIR